MKPWKIILIAASALVLIIPLTAYATVSMFADVPDDHIFVDDINWMKTAGVTNGCGDGTNYCPNDDVTRGQMAAFMHRLATGRSVDAGTLDGRSADDLTSDAFSVWHDAAVAMPSTLGTVLELKNLPAGSYVIVAKAYLTSTSTTSVMCRLYAGSQYDQVVASVELGRYMPASFTVVNTFASNGSSATLRCEDGGANAYVNHTKITAIGVDGLSNTTG